MPFCPSICPYCDFHVLTRRSGLVEQYLAQLERDAARLAQEYAADLDTVYLGGGTPSFLRDEELSALVASVQRHLGWGRLENTLEVNPGTVSPQRAAHWRALGFDRASVGVQSLHDPTLAFLGRQHSAAQARGAVRQLMQEGFRVSGDLITAVAGQPLEDDIRGLSDLGVGHISAYTLTIEPGTEFARRGVSVSEGDEQRGFEVTAALLAELGYERYEISNYARPGQQSRHNLAYWNTQHYLGLGPGAAGHYPPPLDAPALDSSALGARSPHGAGQAPVSLRRTEPHLHEWLAGEAAQTEPVWPHDWVTDALFMGLRLHGGVNLNDLQRRSGVDVQRDYAPALQTTVARGLLTLDAGGQLRATEAGWWILNSVISDFLALDAERLDVPS